MWRRLMNVGDTPLNTYLVERDGVAEGYIVYEQRQRAGERDRAIVARDLVALTPGAARTLLAFLAGHRVQPHGTVIMRRTSGMGPGTGTRGRVRARTVARGGVRPVP